MGIETLDPPKPKSRPYVGNQRTAYLLMLTSSTAFAVMGACAHGLDTSGHCDWRVTPIARASIALIVTAWLARAGRVRLRFWRPRTLWMRSIVGSISVILSFFALSELDVSTAYTLFNTFPLWVTLLAWPVLGDRPTAIVGLALVCGMCGVALIEQPSDGVRLATIAALASSVCTAIVMLGLHRMRELHALSIVVHFSGLATLVTVSYLAWTVYAGYALGPTDLTDPVVLALLGAVGVFAAIGQIAMTKAFSLGPPQKLAVVGLSQVVVAVSFDFGVWGRTLNSTQLLGTILVLAPVAWLVGRPRP